MRAAAAEQEFERAAAIRNRLAAVQHLMERQFATAGSVGTADVLGIAMEGDSATCKCCRCGRGAPGPPVVLPGYRRCR
jgi:excinuclease UvrABC nuclease subunit